MSSSSRSESVASQMFDDLVIEILARLPTRSLRRFQCVSKAWRGFVSDEVPSRRGLLLRPMSGLFFDTRSRHDRSNNGNYVPILDPRHHDYCGAFESRLSRLPFYSPSTAVLHSCNGLLLLSAAADDSSDGPVSYVVWNPATSECVALPRPRPRRAGCQYALCLLAFDPRESPHYKVVRLILQLCEVVSVEIYSSMSGDWVELSSARRYPAAAPIYSCCVYMSLFHKGALHIPAAARYLIRFDVEMEEFQVLPLPRRWAGANPPCIWESGGRLHYAVNLPTPLVLEVWMLDEEGSCMQWLLRHRVSTKVFDRIAPRIRPLAFNPDSEVMYLRTPGKILAYRPSSGEAVEICPVAPGLVNSVNVFIVSPCLESIDPPGGKFIRAA